MSNWKKPLPVISGETRQFWKACKKGVLLIQHCSLCESYQFYPRALCANCWNTDVTWVESKGEGHIWTYTVTYQNRTAGFVDEIPYIVALVLLKEGVKLFTNIIDCNPKDVEIGMEVRVKFVTANDQVSVPYFTPI